MSRIILIASGKGGVGKSTVAVQLGRILADGDRRILLIDADAGLRNDDLLLGVGDRLVYDLGDVLRGRCTPAQALCRVDEDAEFFTVAAPADTEDWGSSADIGRVVRGYARYFDAVLVDCPAGLGEGLKKLLPAADEALVVTTPDLLCARDAQKTGQLLRGVNVPARLIVNRLRVDRVRKGLSPDLDALIDAAGIRLIGAVPEEEEVQLAGAAGRPLDPNSRALYCLENIAARCMGEEVPLAPLEKWY